LLTLTAALAARLDVGFLALTVSTSAVGEWLQPLQWRQRILQPFELAARKSRSYRSSGTTFTLPNPQA
jgi:hypothetical protein